jgi:hypothetical protein
MLPAKPVKFMQTRYWYFDPDVGWFAGQASKLPPFHEGDEHFTCQSAKDTQK